MTQIEAQATWAWKNNLLLAFVGIEGANDQSAMESLYYACVTSAYQVLRLLVHHWTEYWFSALVQVQSNSPRCLREIRIYYPSVRKKKKGMKEFKDQVDNKKKNNNSHNTKQVSSLIHPV